MYLTATQVPAPPLPRFYRIQLRPIFVGQSETGLLFHHASCLVTQHGSLQARGAVNDE